MATVQDIIIQEANAAGVDPNTLLMIARLESNYNPAARNPTSSAGGLFQFTDRTAGGYGLPGDTRYDAAASTRAAIRLMAANTRQLQNALGREPTAAELYLAHQQGGGGAGALLRNPGANVVDALAPAYGGDRQQAAAAVTQNGGNAGMTAGQFAALWTNKANSVLGRIPPGEVPGNAVGTQLDVTRPPRTFNYTPQGRPRDPANGFLMAEDHPDYGAASLLTHILSNQRPAKAAPKPAPRSQATAARTNATFRQTQPPATNTPRKLLPSIGPTGVIPKMDDIGSMPFFGELARLAASDGSRSSQSNNSGVVRTNGIAGSVALPAGVRPNVPSTDSDTEPKRMFSHIAGFAGGSNVPFAAPRPQTYAGQDGFTTKKILNPAYTQALEERKKIPLGDVFHGLSRDAVAQRAAGLRTAANLPAQWITVRTPVAPKPAAVPFSRGNGGGSSPAPTPFSGTSTGKSYTPGQVYRTGDGRQMRANADGSFTNINSGQKSAGSSGSVTSGGKSYDRLTGNWV